MKIVITLIYAAIIGLVCFFVGALLPRRRFKENAFPFRAYSFEENGRVFQALRVKKWKSKLPDMSRYTDMIYPKKICSRVTSEDIDRLIKESCIAELTHYVLSVLGVGIYYIWKKSKVGLWLTIAYIAANAPYIIIQRYLRPKYIRLREKLIIREGQQEYAKV